MCLDTGHRHFLKGFLFKADKVPAYLALGKMKTSQPVVVEGSVETKLPCPEVQPRMCVFYLLFTVQPVQTPR